MSVRATVLYDAPGPKGRRNNRIYSLIAGIIFLAIIGWVAWTLNNNGQFEGRLWTPFLDTQTWTTYLLPGLRGTLFSAFASILLACVFGVVLGLGRLSENRLVRWICGVIVEFFRAIPVLLLMIFAYQLFAVYNVVPSRHLAFSAVVFALTLYNGSVIAEILRSGIRSLPKGQTEAAKALGLSHRLTMYRVLLPQAIAAMLPALIAQMVIALKDSALGYQIGYIEIVRSGIQSASYNQNFLASLVIVGIIMVLINWGLTTLAQRIERQLRAGRARKNIIAKVPEEPDQGLDTKDNVNVDWHNPNYKQVRNPSE
ncbi:MAG: amino acid ABC transporter permease [Corynebacterium casei]|jgi:glutamate transport system permease protein|uniref:amino acid ABC transporter permease n=1 Tax=Corynebacterium casei TaxID=160386 RepID=UPI0026471671|nr:amino acid ABC transporter permease [Corynebacterium casei]MDN5728428.1 amino acid ABC transporter permease [Corynebacterium casei]MDN5839714.1 amino acid ABC transporter permease [Corynebacterium casei]MDN5883602.1 amino acid ABC transporter permease [Corynebacterium casei]MDN6154274.1 amino acid ABC transporter permease [Corynebacterium casei]MDN6274045.1 amino acid ABC transporter permease [Corynebacterium casei]